MEGSAKDSVVMRTGVRIPEWLCLGFFAYATAASFIFSLSLRQRLTVVGLNLVASGVVLLLTKFGTEDRSPFLAIVRDWIPCVLILVAYRESGLFVTPDPSHRLDLLFIRLDDILLKNSWVRGLLTITSPWLQRYLEFAYFLCYPSVPLGIGALYLARRVAPGFTPTCTVLKGGGIERRYKLAIEQFWTTVLLAVLTCYVLFPFFPLTPPRELFHDLPGPQVAPLLRGMNHWILGRYAVGASLFPSGHVAAVTAMALAIRAYLPRAGILFMVLAVSIALATVYGRYHYAADALAGGLVGITAFVISRALRQR
jgi:membrane-associated phospholipid phosphatase